MMPCIPTTKLKVAISQRPIYIHKEIEKMRERNRERNRERDEGKFQLLLLHRVL